MSTVTTKCQHALFFTTLSLLLLIVILIAFLAPMGSGPDDYVRPVTRVVILTTPELYRSTRAWGNWSTRTRRTITRDPARTSASWNTSRYGPPAAAWYNGVALLGPGQALPGAFVRGRRQDDDTFQRARPMRGYIMTGPSSGPQGPGMQMQGRLTGLTPGQTYGVTMHRFGDMTRGCGRLGPGMAFGVPESVRRENETTDVYTIFNYNRMNPVMVNATHWEGDGHNHTHRHQNVDNNGAVPVYAGPAAGAAAGPLVDQAPVHQRRQNGGYFAENHDREKRQAEPVQYNSVDAIGTYNKMNPVMSHNVNDYNDYNGTLVGVFTANDTGNGDFEIYVVSGTTDSCGNFTMVYGRAVAVRPIFGTYDEVDVEVSVNETHRTKRESDNTDSQLNGVGWDEDWDDRNRNTNRDTGRRQHYDDEAFERKHTRIAEDHQPGNHTGPMWAPGYTRPSDMRRFGMGPGMRVGMPVGCGVFARM